MWQFIEVAPQPFGECTVCKRHVCGEYTDENGTKRQKWAHLPIEMDKGGNLVIGYHCIKGMSEDAGINLRVVEKVKEVPPTDEQLLRVFREQWAAIPATEFAALKTQEIPDNGGVDAPVTILSPHGQPQKRRGRAAK